MTGSERFEVELPMELAQFVHSQVGQGALASEADVVREAVRVLHRQQAKLAELRAMVNASIDDPRPGLTAKEVRDRLRTRTASYPARGDDA